MVSIPQKYDPAKRDFCCWGRFSQTLSYIGASATAKCRTVCNLRTPWAGSDAPACISGPIREIRHTLQHFAAPVSGLHRDLQYFCASEPQK